MSTVRPTGIENFDREIGGGLRPGSIVGLVTPAESQGEQLLRAIAQKNPTIYISTTRAEAAVRDWIFDGETPSDASDTDVYYAGIDQFRPEGSNALRDWLRKADTSASNERHERHYAHSATQLDAVLSAIRTGRKEIAIIDPVNPLEYGDESLYTTFLHQLQTYLQSSGAIVILHLVETPEPPDCRWLNLQIADEVWGMTVEVTGERVEFRLTVTKSRTGSIPSRQIKFQLADDVTIDTSRDIA